MVDGGWIVKGATALIARGIGTRSTRDIDIYRADTPANAEADLRSALHVDIDDGFRFELGPTQPVGDGAGMTLQVDAFIGVTLWARFHIDLVGSDLRMTGQPESVPALAKLDRPGFVQGDYLAYPLVDHVADKVAAIYETHGDGNYPSSRYKDLVDLVSIAQGSSVDAATQIKAVHSEFARRGLRLPSDFAVPDTNDWPRGYAREARQLSSTVPGSLAEAVAIVSKFLNPLLDGTAIGNWNATQQAWL
jgi:hypothetical protein